MEGYDSTAKIRALEHEIATLKAQYNKEVGRGSRQNTSDILSSSNMDMMGQILKQEGHILDGRQSSIKLIEPGIVNS